MLRNFFSAAVIFCVCFSGILSGAELLDNGGFEELDPATGFPLRWGKHWVYTGKIDVRNDLAFAQDGSISLAVDQTAEGASEVQTTIGSQRLKGRPGERFVFTLWARGKGELRLSAFLYGANTYLEAEKPLETEWFTIDSEQWKQYSLDFTLPENGVAIYTDQSTIGVEEYEVLFHVRGGVVFCDGASLRPWGEKVEEKKDAAFKGDFSRSPMITFPRLKEKPVIDGKLSEGEWSAAAATTGFVTLEDGAWSPRQTVVYAGYDDEQLYIAFSSRQEVVQLGMGSETIFDASEFENGIEGFEVWLSRDGVEFFQLLVVPGGGFTSGSSRADSVWADERLTYRASIQESGTMSGGIMTMDAKTWLGEIAIPFALLGGDAPKPGESWRINFCRDFSTINGEVRTGNDWTCWAPGFNAVPKFGYGVFGDEPDAGVQLCTLGNLANGELNLTGSAPEDANIQWSVSLPGAAGKIAAGGREIGTGEAFGVRAPLQGAAGALTAMSLQYQVTLPESSEPVAQLQLPFTLLPGFFLVPRLAYEAQELEVTADVSRFQAPEGSRIAVSIVDGAGTELAKAITALAEPKQTLTLSTKNFQPGRYLVRGALLDADNRELASANSEFVFPEKPAWLHTALWDDRSVPAPFTPVKVSGSGADVLRRHYEFGGNGLPAAIESAGSPLLAAPSRIALKVNGKNEILMFDELEVLEQADDLVSWRFNGRSDSVQLSGIVTLEFDGFVRWQAELTPLKGKGAVVNELALEFPVVSEEALFVRGDGFTGSLLQDIYTQSPRESKVVQLGNSSNSWGNWMYDASGWNWTERFFHEMVIGSEKRALAVMTENPGAIRGKRYAQVDQTNDAATLKIHLVSEDSQLLPDGKFQYDYFLQALPVKNEPADPKAWHIGLDPGSVFNAGIPGYTSPEGLELLRSLSVGQVYYDLLPDGYAVWNRDAAEAEKGMRKFQSYGMKLAHNLWYSAIADHMDEYKTYALEWEAFPTFFWTTPHARMTATCLNSTYADFLLCQVDGIVNKLGLDGVYTDATAIPCSNGRHGCGYVDADGVRRPTLNLLATRRFVKQMYRIFKAGGRDRINFSHSGESPACAAFVDVRTFGEELIWEGLDHYRRLTPDYFRAKYAQTEYGMPVTHFAVFHYSWRKVGEAVPVREVLMMTLPHRVSFPLTYDMEVLPVWKIVDPWWTAAEFIPYWRQECPVRTSEPAMVLSSVFRRVDDGRALVILANWNYEPRRVRLEIDPDKLGFEVGRAVEWDTVEPKEIPLEWPLKEFELPARDFRILELRAE